MTCSMQYDKIENRHYLPIRFGNILVDLSLGVFGTYYISEVLDHYPLP